MKFLYVLTSTETDVYYEQFLLSATSLRMKMPTAYIMLLTDNDTEKTLGEKRNGFRKIVDEIKVVYFPSETSMHYRSRFLKTTLRNHIEGDFLFLDCDTIIADNLSDLEKFDGSIGMVLDHHTLMSDYNGVYKELQKHYDNILSFESVEKMNQYYNSGVLFCKDNEFSHKFFDQWHDLWLYCIPKGINVDQPSLNQTNYLMNGLISEISGIYNCQIGDNGVSYLHNAKILHYYNTFRQETFLLSKKSVFQAIKDSGKISDEIMYMLDEPRRCFDKHSCVLSDSTYIRLMNKLDIKTIPLSVAYKYILKRSVLKLKGKKCKIE